MARCDSVIDCVPIDPFQCELWCVVLKVSCGDGYDYSYQPECPIGRWCPHTPEELAILQAGIDIKTLCTDFCYYRGSGYYDDECKFGIEPVGCEDPCLTTPEPTTQAPSQPPSSVPLEEL